MRLALSKLDAIFEWNMSPAEAETYRIALIWEQEVEKIAPPYTKNSEWYRKNHLPKKGDPRKCLLFKHCWKFRRLTIGLLKEEEIRLYIVANLTVLKANNAYMEANVLCGDQAWIRWKIWKRHFDRKMAEETSSPPPPVAEDRVTRELLRTKRFIYEKCEGTVNQTTINSLFNRGSIKLWVQQGKISIYYIMLSPFMKEHIQSLSKDCCFDPELFLEKIDKQIKNYFQYEFNEEFQT